jgi:SAM-dependent methyltransferase
MDISQFDLQAEIEDRHWWFKARREIILSVLRQYVPVHKNKLIVEIGCGTGGNLKFFKEYYQMIGIDISPEAVKYAMQRVDCKVLLGDFRDKLAAMWHDIDAVILPDVLEHINDDFTFLRDIIKSLKPNSVLLITVPAHSFLWSHHDIVLGHKRRYSAKNLHSLYNGLEVEKLFFSPFNSLIFPAIAFYRILSRKKQKHFKSDLSMPPAWLNYLLYKIFSGERFFLRASPFPFGLSYLVVLRKL